MTVEARLADVHQRESVLGAGQTAVMDRVEWWLPTFTVIIC
jgi:hypothetical protein